MERGQIVALPTEVIAPENTPEKKKTDTLVAHPHWKYVGPTDTIRFEWQIGKWGWAGFAGESTRQYATRSQPASTELKEFNTSLPAISLSPLSPGYYDCEIWFKDKFADLRVIVQNCVRIVEEAPPPPTEPEFRDLQIYKHTEKPWQGATCYVHVMFKYQGPKVTKELYAAIGKIWAGVFDEYLYASKTMEISAADFWQTRLGRVEISIPRDADLGIYDLYAKIDGIIPDIISEYYNDVVEIIA